MSWVALVSFLGYSLLFFSLFFRVGSIASVLGHYCTSYRKLLMYCEVQAHTNPHCFIDWPWRRHYSFLGKGHQSYLSLWSITYPSMAVSLVCVWAICLCPNVLLLLLLDRLENTCSRYWIFLLNASSPSLPIIFYLSFGRINTGFSILFVFFLLWPLCCREINLDEDCDLCEGQGSGCHLWEANFQVQMWRSVNLLFCFIFRLMWLINIEERLYVKD